MDDYKATSMEDGTIATVWLVAILALIAGYVDSYAFLNYNVYASFMSGNTTQTGLSAGQARFGVAGLDLLPIPLFVGGIFAGTLVVHSSRRHRVPWLYGLVAALLCLAIAAAHSGPLPGWFGIIMLSFAMGIINCTATRVGGQPVSLGYVTGCLSNLAQHLAMAIKCAPVPNAQGAWDTHQRRAALLAGIWAAFVIGAAIAGAATPRFASWTLLPPIFIMLALSASRYCSSKSSTQKTA